VSSGGTTPCHLAIDAGGTLLALANYDDGVVSTLALDSEGIPRPAFSMKIEGRGPDPHRQEGSHPHGVCFRGTTLHVPDLGVDRVHTWILDPDTARPEREDPGWCQCAPGAGPRHMDFTPDGRHAYVVHELDSTVSALDIGQQAAASMQ
jgi:6-phosphogluconolactonase